MRGGIDPARQARGDDKTGLAQFARQPFGEFHPHGRGVARADDRNHGRREHIGIAAHRQQRRRIIDALQPRRIFRLAQRHEAHADRTRRLASPLGVVTRADARGPRCAATPRQIGQGGKRGRAPPQ